MRKRQIKTCPPLAIKRQECFITVPYVQDATGVIEDYEVKCYQCLICQPNGGGVSPCDDTNTFGAGIYPNYFPPLTDGCKDYATEPTDGPVGPPKPSRLLRA